MRNHISINLDLHIFLQYVIFYKNISAKMRLFTIQKIAFPLIKNCICPFFHEYSFYKYISAKMQFFLIQKKWMPRFWRMILYKIVQEQIYLTEKTSEDKI